MSQQLLLLGALLGERMHGYQLSEYVSHTMGLCTDLKKPTVYYTLEKLEKDGYIQQEVEREGRRPERRVCQITEKGRAYFLNLLRENLCDFTRTYYADDIGIAFLDRLPAAEARQLLSEKCQRIESALHQFQELPEHGGNWRYVIRHHIAHLEADIAWANSILSEMDDAKS